MNVTTPNEEQIRETAYGFWLDDGQPQGRDEEHWLRALNTLAARTQPARKAAAKPRAASKRAAKPRAKSIKK